MVAVERRSCSVLGIHHQCIDRNFCTIERVGQQRTAKSLALVSLINRQLSHANGWEGIVTYLLLVKSGFTERRSSWLAFVAAAASTPLGMLVSCPMVSSISQPSLGLRLCLSAGVLVYVGAPHLLPAVRRQAGRSHRLVQRLCQEGLIQRRYRPAVVRTAA